ncbi:hypothetical protein [Massilia psychrophila]|uniref:HAF repeat-containing protein n=1 Tax=Massilia psychrophila TaxID=1603353 RepID=A0A2G8SYQ8_9BURK|nr:hypothetical protein [Massilia psychrophila]PIL38891.1 hypothetical protein CR103_15810 [Massilia psychrophila]GGE91951.1 hypothetical protein GCM10008020_41200 [Massilia psychrophila]
MKAILIAILAWFIFPNCAIADPDVKYFITKIGTLGGRSSTAYAINNMGQVAGSSTLDVYGNTHAFVGDGVSILDLGTLGGWSSASGINDLGEVVGTAVPSTGAPYSAFFYKAGAITDLGALGGTASVGMGINNKSQVVGNAYTSENRERHPFLYSAKTMADLNPLPGGQSTAAAINIIGQVAGSINNNAFIYSDGVMTDLGKLDGLFSQAAGINDIGEVVGNIYYGRGGFNDSWVPHAFFYFAGSMVDIGTLGGRASNANGLNNLGQVVGNAFTLGDAAQAGFLYEKSLMIDLNTLIGDAKGWYINDAVDINEHGQIAATACKAGFGCQAVRLDLINQIPEPGSNVLLLIGLTAAFFTWYNQEHRHSGIGMMTSESVHTARAAEIHGLRRLLCKMPLSARQADSRTGCLDLTGCQPLLGSTRRLWKKKQLENAV